MNQAINFLNSQPHCSSSPYCLTVRQQPSKARLCSFKEKVDRRPIDPPPIIELLSNSSNDDFLQNPYFFLYATLTDASGEVDLHFINGNKTTAGSVVQSLHKLKDLDNSGFPGMSESTFLTRCFSDQGVRIRIRKEPRSAHLNSSGKRRRGHTNESDEDDTSSVHEIYIENRTSLPPPSHFAPYVDKPPSPIDYTGIYSNNRNDYFVKPTLPSPKQLFKSSAMSMQNILSNDRDQLYHISPMGEDEKENRLLSTRKLPLPLPSYSHFPHQNGNLAVQYNISLNPSSKDQSS
ncbi:hypothetical protein G6F43_002855 [Rhizopus delemar]|nr:hypothetical protein G6F43_002855 [Rhizopus delemar]